MGESSFNPYIPPSTSQEDSRASRPVGIIVFAVVLFVFGVWLGGGGLTRFIQNWLERGPPSNPRAYVPFVHFGIVAAVALVASLGLTFRRLWGWWSAIVFCYLVFATFVLVPAARFEPGDPVLRRIVFGMVLLLCWSYLHRKNVRTYVGETNPRLWRKHAGFFAVAVLLVFASVSL